MSGNYLTACIDQNAISNTLSGKYSARGSIPVSSNFELYDGEGVGLIIEEMRNGLFRIENVGQLDFDTRTFLVTENRMNTINTTGAVVSLLDDYSDQPLIVEGYH